MPAKNAVSAQIGAYVASKNPKLEPVVNKLRALVKRTLPETTESINAWGIPTFESNGPFAYFMVNKNHLTLGFVMGTSLADSAKLLEGTGKNLRHVKIRSVEDLQQQGLSELLLEASRLNASTPARSMGRKKTRPAD